MMAAGLLQDGCMNNYDKFRMVVILMYDGCRMVVEWL